MTWTKTTRLDCGAKRAWQAPSTKALFPAAVALMTALALLTQVRDVQAEQRWHIAELSLQGTLMCDGSPQGKWTHDRWEAGFCRLHGPAATPVAMKGLTKKLVALRGTPTKAPAIKPTIRKGACPMVPQMRSDWEMGRSGVRIRRHEPVFAGFKVTQAKKWSGLSVRRSGTWLELTLRNDFKSTWQGVDIAMHYEGCGGKPGTASKRQRADLIKPGQAVVARFPAHAGFGKNMAARQFTVRGKHGPVTFDISRSLYHEGASVDCLKRARRARPWQPFENKAGDFGYKDARGTVKLKPQWHMAEPFNDGGIAHVVGKKGLAVIDRGGKKVLQPLSFDNGPDPFSGGLARFVQSGKIGFYAPDGRVVIPAKFDFARPFHDRRAVFCIGCKKHKMGEHWTMRGGRWGYVDGSGREVIAANLKAAQDFQGGYATVKDSRGKQRRITADGTVVSR